MGTTKNLVKQGSHSVIHGLDGIIPKKDAALIGKIEVLKKLDMQHLSYWQFVGLLRTSSGYDAMSAHLKKMFCSELTLFLKEVEDYTNAPTVKAMYSMSSQYI